MVDDGVQLQKNSFLGSFIQSVGITTEQVLLRSS